MSRHFKALVLTDHSGHTAENSIYALMSRLALHEQVSSVKVCSRGDRYNEPFFADPFGAVPRAIQIGGEFTFDPSGRNFEQDLEAVDIDSTDLVIMRLPRAISDQWLLRLDERFAHACLVNDPIGIIKTSSKTMLLDFPTLCPPMKLCRSAADVLEFCKTYKTVLKPLRDYGGKGIVSIENEEVERGGEYLSLDKYLDEVEDELHSEGLLAMKFLEGVKRGDLRSIVVAGEILASSLRMPRPGEWLCNVSQGGYSMAAAADDSVFEIVRTIDSVMRENGILIYGVDTLVGDQGSRVLSEVNTLSIGGFPQAEAQTGRPIIQRTIEHILRKAKEFHATRDK